MTQQALAVTTQTVTPIIRVAFTARRATASGISYKADDGHVTTVNGTSSTCSCGMSAYSVICIHRIAALSQEKAYEQEAKVRNAYCAEFSIY